jgi:hypothetical protein
MQKVLIRENESAYIDEMPEDPQINDIVLDGKKFLKYCYKAGILAFHQINLTKLKLI